MCTHTHTHTRTHTRLVYNFTFMETSTAGHPYLFLALTDI